MSFGQVAHPTLLQSRNFSDQIISGLGLKLSQSRQSPQINFRELAARIITTFLFFLVLLEHIFSNWQACPWGPHSQKCLGLPRVYHTLVWFDLITMCRNMVSQTCRLKHSDYHWDLSGNLFWETSTKPSNKIK